jgi:hypothetical protein
MTPVKIGMRFGVTHFKVHLSHWACIYFHNLYHSLSFSLSLSRYIYIYIYLFIYIYIIVPKCGTGLQQDFLTLCAVVLLDLLSLDVEHQAQCCTNLQTPNQGLWFCNQQMGSSQP